MLSQYCGIILREHTCDVKDYYEVCFLRRSIIEVTDLREGGDVRCSPLVVIMGLVDSRTAHTTPRLASVWPSGVPIGGGSYQSREELERRPVS